MLNLSTSKLKSGCAALTVCVLAAVVVPIAASTPVRAQDWIVDDNPEFYDEMGNYSWFTPPANVNSTGYGTNGFRFTIAIGNDPREMTDSWAQWNIGYVNGIYEIEVWIPSAWATAHTGYEVWEDSSRIDTAWINQQNVSGWQPLGTYDLGGYLRVSVYDAVTQDDYRTVGIANARLAVDALRMRRVDANPQPAPPPPPPSTVPGPPRNLSLVLTDADSFHIDWDPPSDEGGSPITGYGVAAQHAGSGDISGWSTVGTSTSFDGVVGATYTVEVWAKNSQGSGPAQRAQITIPSTDKRKVTISFGPSNSGSQYCTYPQLPCRWINITLENFSSGSYFTRCVWQHSESGSERIPISGNINHGGASSADLNNYCSFNVRQGRSVWVTIDGVRSNTLSFTGDGQPPPPPPPPEPDDGPPDKPRDLKVTLSRTGAVVSWEPPSGDRSGTVDSYTVTYSRPELSDAVPSWTRSYRVDGGTHTHSLRTNRGDVTYTVRVVANNGSESSQAIVGEFTSLGKHAHTPVRNIPPMRNSRKDEVPQVTRQYSSGWNKKGHGGGTGRACGAFGGCTPKDGFWHTRIEERDSFAPTYVYWDDFGAASMRGEYSIEFFVPRLGAKVEDGNDTNFYATATARYTIQEQRTGASDWRTVGYFIVDQGESKGQLDTYDMSTSRPRDAGFETREYDERTLRSRHNTGTWELDGKVRITLHGKNGALAADSIRLIQRDLLDIDKRLAIARCRIHALDVLKKHKWIDLGLSLVLDIGGSLALTFVTAGIGSALVAGGLAVKITNTIVATGKIAEFFSALKAVLETVGSLSNIYTGIRTVYELSELIAQPIRQQLSRDETEVYDWYLRSCTRAQGARWHDDRPLLDSLAQAFVRSGYLAYLDPDDVS